MLQPSCHWLPVIQVSVYRAKTHSVYESESKVFKNFVENLPAKVIKKHHKTKIPIIQVNIDNSDTLSKLKKDFNTVLLEKQVRFQIHLSHQRNSHRKKED